MIEQIEMTIDIEIEVQDAKIILTKTTLHKTVIALHLETAKTMTETLLLQNTLDHDIIIIKKIPDHVAHCKYLLIDHLKDVALVIDTDLDLTLETNTLLLLDLLQEQEFLDTLDHAHATKNNTVRPQTSNDTINFEVHVYRHTAVALYFLFGSGDSNFPTLFESKRSLYTHKFS